MIWNTPKRFIEKILFRVSVINFLFLLLFLSAFWFWNKYPAKINQFDREIPNFLDQKITDWQTYISHKKSHEKRLRTHKKILSKLKSSNPLHAHNDDYNQSLKYVIEDHLEKGETDKALELSNDWRSSQPNNLQIQFNYANILKIIDQDRAVEFVKKLSSRLFDVPEVQSFASQFFLELGDFNLALKTAEDFEAFNLDKSKPTFMLYYLDEDNSKYSQKGIIKIDHYQYEKSDEQISIKTPININGLQGLRFDVDTLYSGSMIIEPRFWLSTTDSSFELSIINTQNLQQIDQRFISTNSDPYMFFKIPEELIGYKGELLFRATAEIDARHPSPLQELITQRWRIKESQTENFIELNWEPFGNNQMISDVITVSEGQVIEAELPANWEKHILQLSSLNINQTQLTINDFYKINDLIISESQGLIRLNIPTSNVTTLRLLLQLRTNHEDL